MALDILTLVFEEILKIDPSVISNYVSVQDQLLYLILIPHIIIFLFIYSFSSSFASFGGRPHRGFQYLISIAVYIFMIMAGWYGFLVPILGAWFGIALAIGIIFFIGSKIVHPSRISELFTLGKTTGAKLVSGDKERKALEEERQMLIRQIAKLAGATTDFEKYQRSQLQLRLIEVEQKLSHM